MREDRRHIQQLSRRPWQSLPAPSLGTATVTVFFYIFVNVQFFVSNMVFKIEKLIKLMIVYQALALYSVSLFPGFTTSRELQHAMFPGIPKSSRDPENSQDSRNSENSRDNFPKNFSELDHFDIFYDF